MSISECEKLNFLSSSGSFHKFLSKSLSPKTVNDSVLMHRMKPKKQNKITSENLTTYDERIRHIIKIFSKHLELLKKYIGSAKNPASKLFFICLDEYYTHVCEKLKDTISNKYLRQRIIQDVISKTETLKVIYERRTAYLQRKIINFQDVMTRREREILGIISQKQKLKEENDVDIDDEVYDGKIKMIKKLKSRSEIEQNLKMDEKKAQIKLQKLFDGNQIEQKVLVEQKVKAEQTLKAILLKIDNDIGSRTAEIKSIQGETYAGKQKFEEWKSSIYNQQETIYNVLMNEKEEEESRYRTEKLEEIKINHAAKVIQSSWKKFKIRQRKAAKMSKKKGIAKKSK